MSLTNEILLDLEQRLGCEIDNKIKREKVLKKLKKIYKGVKWWIDQNVAVQKYMMMWYLGGLNE